MPAPQDDYSRELRTFHLVGLRSWRSTMFRVLTWPGRQLWVWYSGTSVLKPHWLWNLLCIMARHALRNNHRLLGA